jgi:O-antigen/teichoic acid export membrane protein
MAGNFFISPALSESSVMKPAESVSPAEPITEQSQQFRSQVGQISRQSGIFFGGTLFTVALGYLFKVYIARTLGAEALGVYSLGMTVVGLAGLFGGMGLTWAASRFPAVYKSTGRMEELRSFVGWSVLILVGVNGLFAVGVMLARHWIADRLYHTPQLAGFLYLFALIMFLGALTTFFGQLLTGYKQVGKRTLITNVAGVVLNMLFAVVLIARGTGLWGYIFAQAVSAAMVLILLVWTANGHTPSAARFSLKPIARPPRQMFSFASAAFAMDIMGFLYAQTDKVIIGVYLNARSVGIYAVAATIVAFVPIALQSVNQIFSATIADLHARGEVELLNRLFQTLTKWIVGLTLPLAAVVILFARALMRIFGHDFEAGWIILVIGTVGQLVNCAVGSVGFLLLMSGNEKRLVRIQLVVGVITVPCCLLLVPRWGVTGAAIAAVIGNVGSNVWCLFEVKKVLGFFPYNRSYWSLTLPAAAVLVAGLSLRIALQSVRPDVIVVGVSMLVAYAVFLGTVLASGLEADDRLIANAIWARVRNSWPTFRPAAHD